MTPTYDERSEKVIHALNLNAGGSFVNIHTHEQAGLRD